jgi:hypothetical protein
MEGGIAIILLFLIALVGGLIAMAYYGLAWFKRPEAEEPSRVGISDDEPPPRPEHTVVTDEANEEFIATPRS